MVAIVLYLIQNANKKMAAEYELKKA